MSAYDLAHYIGTASTDEIGRLVVDRFKKEGEQLNRTGLWNQWIDNWRMYHNGAPGGSDFADAFQIEGTNGEILSVRFNEMRNLLTHMLNLMYANPPALKAVASNADADSLDAAQLYQSILTEKFKTKRVSKHMKRAGEMSMLMSPAWTLVEWNFFAGAPYVPNDVGELTYSGDLRVRAKSVLDLRFDQSKETWDDSEWFIVRERINRFVLQSQFVDQADKILRSARFNTFEQATVFADDTISDDIWVFKFFHRSVNSNLLPDGRYILCLEDGTVLGQDEGNPYANSEDGGITAYPISPNDGLSTVLSYPVASDLAPIQQMLNLVVSMYATNVAAFGAGNLVGPSSNSIEFTKLAGGMNYYGVPSKDFLPASLNVMPESQKDLVSFISVLRQFGEAHSGINSVIRGAPDSNIKSGRMAMIMQAAALQFMNGFNKSVLDNHEDVGNSMLRIFQKYATTQQVTTIVGESGIATPRNWDGDKLKKVARVQIELMNAVTDTLSGRLELADKLIEGGHVDGQEYITVATTGRLDPMIKAPMAQRSLVRHENQKLMIGQNPYVDESDDHKLHIPEHEADIANPDVRAQSKVLGIYKEHIALHRMFAAGLTPQQGPGAPSAIEQLAQAKQQGQNTPAGGGGGPPQGAPPGGGSPQGGGGGAGAVLGPPPGAMPNMGGQS